MDVGDRIQRTPSGSIQGHIAQFWEMVVEQPRIHRVGTVERVFNTLASWYTWVTFILFIFGVMLTVNTAGSGKTKLA